MQNKYHDIVIEKYNGCIVPIVCNKNVSCRLYCTVHEFFIAIRAGMNVYRRRNNTYMYYVYTLHGGYRHNIINEFALEDMLLKKYTDSNEWLVYTRHKKQFIPYDNRGIGKRYYPIRLLVSIVAECTLRVVTYHDFFILLYEYRQYSRPRNNLIHFNTWLSIKKWDRVRRSTIQEYCMRMMHEKNIIDTERCFSLEYALFLSTNG